jgi:chemotaxis protein CheZ
MVQRKVFRVDQMRNEIAAAFAPDPQADAVQRHHEMIMEIRALRAVIEPRELDARRIIETYQAQIAEILKLKTELDLIQAAIADTKQEIATLHVSGFKGREMRRVTDELDAVVHGTADATEHILGAAEEIDRCAHLLSALASNGQEKNLAREIVERVVQIFESCNFHDLTGQRIAKVVATLKFIETHIVKMMEIWGGIEALKEFAPAALAARAGESHLLNGPPLAGDAGHASQDDIDALFS